MADLIAALNSEIPADQAERTGLPHNGCEVEVEWDGGFYRCGEVVGGEPGLSIGRGGRVYCAQHEPKDELCSSVPFPKGVL